MLLPSILIYAEQDTDEAELTLQRAPPWGRELRWDDVVGSTLEPPHVRWGSRRFWL